MNSIQDVVLTVSQLDNMISQADEWKDAELDYAFRRDLIRKYSLSESVSDSVQQLDDNCTQAAELFRGCLVELENTFGTQDLNVLRVLSVKLKTILNTIMDQHSAEFTKENGLGEATVDNMIAIAAQTLNEVRND